MVAAYIKNIMHNVNCATGVYSRKTIYMFWVSQVSGLVENFNTGIFSHTVNIKNVKLFA